MQSIIPKMTWSLTALTLLLTACDIQDVKPSGDSGPPTHIRTFRSGSITLNLRKEGPLEPLDEDSLRTFANSLNIYRLTIDYPASRGGVAKVSYRINRDITVQRLAEVNDRYFGNEAAQSVATLNLNDKKFGGKAMTLSVLVQFNDTSEVSADFDDIRKDLVISAQAGISEHRISEYIGDQDTVAELDLVVIQAGASLVTEGRPLEISIHRLFARRTARIKTFSDAELSNPEIGHGQSGGKIRIIVQNASGELDVLMKGSKGRKGKDGNKGLSGNPGTDGYSGDRNAGCSQPHRQPQDGENGKPGETGGDGGRGGNSGSVEFRVVNNDQFSLQLAIEAGEAGRAGLGGQGGDGGRAGNPGRGESCRWVVDGDHPFGHTACDERACNYRILPDGSMRVAYPGQPGSKAKDGAPGSIGDVEESCIQLAAAAPMKCRSK